jgi:hypothetical protein
MDVFGVRLNNRFQKMTSKQDQDLGQFQGQENENENWSGSQNSKKNQDERAKNYSSKNADDEWYR